MARCLYKNDHRCGCFCMFSAARCYKMKSATQCVWENKIYKDVSDVPKEGFYPFFGETFIAIDQSVKKQDLLTVCNR